MQKPTGTEILGWYRIYCVTLLVSAATWGIGGLLMALNAGLEQQLLIYLFLIGFAGGAISSYSSIRILVVSTIMLLLLPTTLFFLLSTEGFLFHAALAVMTFLISGTSTSATLAKSLDRSIRLSYEHQIGKQEAEKLAKTDFLTQLNNRAAFMEFAEKQFRFCQRKKLPVAVLMLDIDHFKNINDTHGHQVGDRALIQIAITLKLTLRRHDICGRMGGEEFCIFLPDTNRESAMLVAEKVRRAIEETHLEIGDGSLKFTTSLGVASNLDSLDELIAESDKALYQAKESGRNCVIHA